MGQYPDPNWPNPQPFGESSPNYNPMLPYATPVSSLRPASVTAMAIVGIVLGSLGLICNAFGLITTLLMGPIIRNMGAAMASAPMNNPVIKVFNLVQLFVATTMSVTLLIGSIGSLKLKPTAYRTIMIWSAAMIIWAVCTTVAQIAFVGPATIAFMKRTQPNNPAVTAGIIGPVFFIASALVGLVLYCTMPVLFLILWRRPVVKAAFGNPLLRKI